MNPPSQRRPVQRLGLWLGAAIFAAMLILPEPAGFLPTAWRAAALTLLMAVWWATGALPIAATSILPLAAGPLLGIVGVEEAGKGYGSSTIFLILGGCLLGLALERSQLHRRIAYAIVEVAGTSARSLVLGVMAATAFVSMSCGFMLPVGTAPNAIVYGSGRVGLRDMMRAGLPLDILAACVVVAVATVAWRWLG